MKIRSAAAAQKEQATQGITQVGQSDANAGADFSLRQEFQAALDNFAGRTVSQGNLSQLSLSTFDTIASGSNQAKTQNRNRSAPAESRTASPLVTERDVSEVSTAAVSDEDTREQHNDSQESQLSDEQNSDDDAAALDVKTVAIVESSAATIVAVSRSNGLNPIAAQAPVTEKSIEVSLPTPVVANQPAPESKSPAVAASAPGTDKPKSDVPYRSSAQATTVEQAPTANIEAVLASAAESQQVVTQESVNDSAPVAKGPITPEISALRTPDAAALALSAAINSTLTQRLAAAVGSGSEQISSRNPSTLAQQLVKSESPSVTGVNNIHSDIRGDLGGKTEVAKNTEQAVRQARIQPSKILERVESTLKEAAKSRDGKTNLLEFDPPELGAVKVDVSIRDGSLHARVTAENSQVAAVIREKAHELQSMLRKLGLAVEKVSVSVHEEASGKQGDFSQTFSNSGNSRSQNQEKPREFNDFGAGSSIALAEQTPLLSLTPEGKRQLEVNNGWVA